MTHSIIIHQNGGFFKNTPGFETLKKEFSGVLHVGGIGRYFEFVEQPLPADDKWEAAYMLYGKTGPLGRGFYLYIAKGFACFEVTTPLPTTTHDLEDMFAFAGHLGKFLGVKQVEDQGKLYPLAYLAALYPDVAKANQDILHSYAIGRPGFAVSGVRFPVQVPLQVCARMARVPAQNTEPFFSDCLDEKQRVNAIYLMPAFSRDEGSSALTGRYIVQEGQNYVLPKSPFVPYGPNPFGREEMGPWRAVLKTNHLGVLAALPYSVFLQRLTGREKQEFDEKHFLLHGLDLQRMQEIAGDT